MVNDQKNKEPLIMLYGVESKPSLTLLRQALEDLQKGYGFEILTDNQKEPQVMLHIDNGRTSWLIDLGKVPQVLEVLDEEPAEDGE